MRTRTLLLTVFAAVLGLILARSAWSVSQFRDTLAQYDAIVREGERASQAVERAQSLAIDLETGVRGWLVTHDASFRQPYELASARKHVELDELVRATPATADAKFVAERVRASVLAWDTELARPLLDRGPGMSDAERLAVNQDGKRRMDAIRVDLDHLRETAARVRIAERTSLGDFEQTLSRDAVLVTSSIAAILLLLGLVILRLVETPLAEVARLASDGSTSSKNLLALRGVAEVRILAKTLFELDGRIQRERRREQDFTSLVSALARGGSVKNVADAALTSLLEGHDGVVGVIWVLGQDGTLRLAASTGVRQEELSADGDALAMDVVRKGREIRIDDLREQSGRVLRTAVADAVPRRLVVAPLVVSERIVGIVEVAGALPDERRPSFERALSSVAIALRNALAAEETKELGERVARANDELVSQNEELRTQEEELRAQREELLAKQSALTERTEELAKASRAKSDFLSNMSHELRTPLNAVIGFAEVLLAGTSGELAEQQRRWVGDIAGAAHQLRRLVDDLLDLARIEAETLKLDVSEIDLAGSMRDAAKLLERTAVEKNVRIDVDEGSDLRCIADPTRARQVVANLLSNAVKFTPSGGRVRVSARIDGDFVRVEVVDGGPGVAAGDSSKLFRPFSQLAAGARMKGGTGLGLSISKELVERMGGRIGVKSADGGGAVFFFTLPRVANGSASAHASGTESRAPLAGERSVPNAPSPISPGSTLVVAPHAQSPIIRDLLGRAGHVTEGAMTLDEARAAARAVRFRLVVVDLAFDPAAFDYVRSVRRSFSVRRAPCVLLVDRDLDPAERAELDALGVLVIQKGVMTDRGFVDGIEGILQGEPALRVLVIDDNETNRRVARAILEGARLRVEEADSAEKGIELARRYLPNAIVMDIRMPEMDGLEATQRLHEDPATRHLPVVALSAQAMVGDADRALDAGCVAYVTKPVSRRELLDAVTLAVDGPR